MLRRFGTATAAMRRWVPTLSEIDPVDLAKYQIESTPAKRFLSKEAREELEYAGEPVPTTEDEGLIKSFLYGSPSAQREAAQLDQSFSSKLQHGDKVHELVVHRVIPSRLEDYVELLTETSKEAKAGEGEMDSGRISGSWRVVLGGDVDTFYHLWEYDGLAGLHRAKKWIHSSEVYLSYLDKLRPMLRSRESQLVQEFGFWGGTAKPRELGGIFELRSYTLKPGKMAEWELHWRKGIEYRRRVMEPVGAWFSNIGNLNRVYHLWQFTDLQQRKLSRQKSWEMPGWADTTHETVKLIDNMQSSVLLPLTHSPLK